MGTRTAHYVPHGCRWLRQEHNNGSSPTFYIHRFFAAVEAAFNDYTFYFTATTGSAAALFGGTTIYSAAHLNKTRLTDKMRAIWREDVRILIIDKISFFRELSTSKHSTGTLKSSPEDTTWSMVASPLSSPEISTNSTHLQRR